MYSRAGTQIEHLRTSAKQLALAEIDAGDKANALTVLGNVRAMEAAIQLAADISEDSILAMHKALMLHQPGFDPSGAGRWRDEQVWIGSGQAGPLMAEFVAPHHDRVHGAITDLVKVIDRQDVSVLVQVAVSHAQFETIHPLYKPSSSGRSASSPSTCFARKCSTTPYQTFACCG
ncbi:Fic family protein [Paenarthrobacter sp. NPDC056912]|uniref:Fic family protein n=1 Tax=Paenarthrobacter sp. NPDC056912 TaxID=3345965 RepID=UPI00366DD227